jgi:hypothetical protein
MLRVAIELLPGGREIGKRTVGVAEIVNVGGGRRADYKVSLTADTCNAELNGMLEKYPRWTASVCGPRRASCCESAAGSRASAQASAAAERADPRVGWSALCPLQGYSRAGPLSVRAQHRALHLSRD